MAWLKNRIYDRFLNRMPVKEAEVVQLARGQMNFRTMEIWGRDAFVLRIASNAHASFTARPHAGWIGILIPVSWTGEFRVNGYHHAPKQVCYLNGTHDYTVPCRESVIRVRPSVKRAVCKKLSSRLRRTAEGNDQKSKKHGSTRLTGPVILTGLPPIY